MRGREDLGVVETIYEEDQEVASNSKSYSSSTLSPTPSFPFPMNSPSTLFSSLQGEVEEWSRRTGSKTNLVVRVQDKCFNLHKEPLVSRIGYIRRHVAASPVLTLTPPSTITATTFAAIAAFCYTSDISITPSNVAALRVAAEWLEMWEEYGDEDGNLLEKAEWYFCQTVASSKEYAALVLRACVKILPEEAAGELVGRCVEALAAADGGGKCGWVEDLVGCGAEKFQMVVDDLRGRFTNGHDLLYRIVDQYFKKWNTKLTEEEKNQICRGVECEKLTRTHLIHLVRNPRMPLRFVVQAMLVEQFHTRVSLLDGVHTATIPTSTLESLLQRDAAFRQAALLKAEMDTTSSKIITLERELKRLKQKLREKRGIEGETELMSWEKDGKGLGWRLMRGFRSVFGSERRRASCGGGEDVICSEELRRIPSFH